MRLKQRSRLIHDPDVVLTDLLLAFEASALAWRMGGGPAADSPVAHASRSLLRSVAIAAAAVGIMHGFCPNEESTGHCFLWPLTLLSAGWSCSAGLRLAAHVHGLATSHRLALLDRIWYAVYATLVLVRFRHFSMVIVRGSPAAILLCAAFANYAARRNRQAGGFGLSAIALSGLSALVHRKRITLHPRLMTPDAGAHVLQGVALICLSMAAKLLGEPVIPTRNGPLHEPERPSLPEYTAVKP